MVSKLLLAFCAFVTAVDVVVVAVMTIWFELAGTASKPGVTVAAVAAAVNPF